MFEKKVGEAAAALLGGNAVVSKETHDNEIARAVARARCAALSECLNRLRAEAARLEAELERANSALARASEKCNEKV